MSNKELKELMSIICEGQDSEQRRKVENFIEYQVQLIDSLDKEIERQKEIIKQLDIKNLELTTTLKEVREYIEQHTDKLKTTRIPKINFNYKELLEILDKEK